MEPVQWEGCNNWGCVTAIGQITGDNREQIASITWYLQNKVRSVVRTPASLHAGLTFHDDATGNRVRKTVNPAGRRRALAGVVRAGSARRTRGVSA